MQRGRKKDILFIDLLSLYHCLLYNTSLGYRAAVVVIIVIVVIDFLHVVIGIIGIVVVIRGGLSNSSVD